MKKIEAVVEPLDVDTVHADLLRAGIDWMTIGDVLIPEHRRLAYRGVFYDRAYEPKVRLELAVPDGELAMALDVLMRTTERGGPIATDVTVLPIYDAVRIRTGERLVWPRPDRPGPAARHDVPARRPAA